MPTEIVLAFTRGLASIEGTVRSRNGGSSLEPGEITGAQGRRRWSLDAMRMQLTLGLNGVVLGPTETQVEQAIRSLPGGDDSYAILAETRRDDRSKEYYIQTLGGPTEGYLLEYREGSSQRHFRCATTDLSTEAVLAAFLDYFHGRADYRVNLQWVQESPEDTSSLPGMVLAFALAVLIGLVAYLLVW